MSEPTALTDYQNPEPLETLVADTLSLAKADGATSAAASAGENSGLSVTVRLGNVETIEHHRSKHLGITVYFGQKTGSATTTDFSATSVKEAVAAACRIARFTQEDDCAGLADADRMAREFPDLDLYRPWQLDAQGATDIALQAESAARDHDSRITNSEGASVNTYAGCSVYGNSHGFIGVQAGTRHGLSCSVIAEQDGDKQRDYWYTSSRHPESLEAAASVGKVAAQRAIKRLNARKLSTRDVPILFSNDLAPRLFSSFVSAIRGSSLYRDASFLIDHLNKPVFADHVQITEDPLILGGAGSSPYDGEGVQTEKRNLVIDGVLQGYVLDSYSGRKLGMPSTANAGGIHNLLVKPGKLGFDELLGEMDTGFLVTELIGMGVNIVTGDYSRGAAGFWVENGEIQYPVHEVTIAGNLKDMFMDIVQVGTDIDERSNYHCGSVLLGNMTVAGE